MRPATDAKCRYELGATKLIKLTATAVDSTRTATTNALPGCRGGVEIHYGF